MDGLDVVLAFMVGAFVGFAGALVGVCACRLLEGGPKPPKPPAPPQPPPRCHEHGVAWCRACMLEAIRASGEGGPACGELGPASGAPCVRHAVHDGTHRAIVAGRWTESWPREET
jgi:hypothetical protein